jgi:hypothetical protein
MSLTRIIEGILQGKHDKDMGDEIQVQINSPPPNMTTEGRRYQNLQSYAISSCHVHQRAKSSWTMM